jgi:hypothetical protein
MFVNLTPGGGGMVTAPAQLPNSINPNPAGAVRRSSPLYLNATAQRDGEVALAILHYHASQKQLYLF